jgi:hypothetical protein
MTFAKVSQNGNHLGKRSNPCTVTPNHVEQHPSLLHEVSPGKQSEERRIQLKQMLVEDRRKVIGLSTSSEVMWGVPR